MDHCRAWQTCKHHFRSAGSCFRGRALNFWTSRNLISSEDNDLSTHSAAATMSASVYKPGLGGVSDKLAFYNVIIVTRELYDPFSNLLHDYPPISFKLISLSATPLPPSPPPLPPHPFPEDENAAASRTIQTQTVAQRSTC